MTPFDAIVGGGAAGLAGAALAHVLATLADRLGAQDWLRGPYGPQFAPIALYTGVFYAAIGAAAGRRPAADPTACGGGTSSPVARSAAVLLGLLGPSLGIALPMLALSRYSGWGMPRGLPATPQWSLAVVAIYGLSIWGTIAALGAATARTARWRGALAAVLGSYAAYRLLGLLLWALPAYGKMRWNPHSFLPSPVNLMDGLLSGAGLCLALSIDQRIRRNA